MSGIDLTSLLVTQFEMGNEVLDCVVGRQSRNAYKELGRSDALCLHRAVTCLWTDFKLSVSSLWWDQTWPMLTTSLCFRSERGERLQGPHGALDGSHR